MVTPDKDSENPLELVDFHVLPPKPLYRRWGFWVGLVAALVLIALVVSLTVFHSSFFGVSAVGPSSGQGLSGLAADSHEDLRKKGVPTVLTLKGEPTMSVQQNTPFTDPGVEASGPTGDLKGQVAVSGAVDTGKVGQYTLTYTLKDAAGSPKTVQRQVNVLAAPPKAGQTTIYLTFDDGPWPGTTSKFLDMLEAEGVKATFFITGENLNTETLGDIKREFNDGDALGLHSMTHRYQYVYASDTNYWQDLNAISNVVQQQTGITSKLVRLPGGASNTVSRNYSKGIMTLITQELTARGYHYFDWNAASGDGSSITDSAKLLANLQNTTVAGRENVVLNHDTHITSLAPVKAYIDWCKAKGYTFALLDMSTPVVHQPVAN